MKSYCRLQCAESVRILTENIKKISRFVHSNALNSVYMEIKLFIMFKKTLKYTLLPFFYTLTFLFFTGCAKDETNKKNHLPKAAFEVKADLGDEEAYRGTLNTVFHFDASMVKDEEDPTELLEVTWDFTNDGVYNTEYSTDKTTTYQYTETGLYFPVLKVRDTKGMVDSIKKMLVVVQDLDNQPPDKPVYISPLDWQKWIDPTNVFKWSGTDPENDELIFDLWLGTRKSNLTLKVSDIDTFETINNKKIFITTVPGLEHNQDYFWKIYARDAAGNYTPGDIWKFTTSQAPE